MKRNTISAAGAWTALAFALALMTGAGCARTNLPLQASEVASQNRRFESPAVTNVDDAIANYTKAIQLNSNNASAYQARGAARGFKGDLDGAIQDCTLAVTLAPNYTPDYPARGSAIAYLTLASAEGAKGDLDAAVRDSARAIELAPGNARAYFCHGIAKQAGGDLNSAIEDYDKALRIDPHYADAWQVLGNAKQAKGDLREAIADYDNAIRYTEGVKIKLIPNIPLPPIPNVIPDTIMSIPYVILCNPDIILPDTYGIRLLQTWLMLPSPRIVVLNPNNVDSLNNRGVAEFKLGLEEITNGVAKEDDKKAKKDFDKGNLLLDRAIEDFSKAIELKPDFEHGYNNRGIAKQAKVDNWRRYAWNTKDGIPLPYFKTQQPADSGLAEADADFSMAIKLKKEYVHAYDNRSALRMEKGDLAGASADHLTAIDLQEYDAWHDLKRGMEKRSAGDLAGAIADFNQAILQRPDFGQAYQARGEAEQAEGKLELARADQASARRLNAFDAKAEFDHARVKYISGHQYEAIAEFTEAIRLKPDYVEAYYSRAEAEQAKGDFDLAIIDYMNAIRLKPDYAEAYFRRATAHLSRNELDAALADFSDAIRLKPDYAQAYYRRSKAKQKNGDWDGAIADLTEIIRMKPDNIVLGELAPGLTLYEQAYIDRAALKNLKGVATRDKQELTSSEADYTKVIELKPDYAEAYSWRATEEASLGELDAALADQTKAKETDLSNQNKADEIAFIKDRQLRLNILEKKFDPNSVTANPYALSDDPAGQNRPDLTDLETQVDGHFYTLLARISLLDWMFQSRQTADWAKN